MAKISKIKVGETNYNIDDEPLRNAAIYNPEYLAMDIDINDSSENTIKKIKVSETEYDVVDQVARDAIAVSGTELTILGIGATSSLPSAEGVKF